ncbi:hypothetical protein [Novosphingobium sp. Gsoil 351]|uniref:hypothetical protein n=1 Tax=Novosphingobium sp. Gsoil 351 TaxID=2675225 RepID=UPI0012B4C5CA|nr:hypothetical protein [Novosphingobium sp. Gsoil 351]QGN55042.1 hypothetical protein GKE62_11220 [Novosphingobium sp. Gsoil 351]
MEFITTWYAGETAISRERASTFAAGRDIAKCRMVAHRVRSGATHVQVHSSDGAVLFDSRDGGEQYRTPTDPGGEADARDR